MAGSDLSDSLMKFVSERKYPLERRDCVCVKERRCYMFFTTTLSSNRPRKVLTNLTYELPNIISLGADRFRFTSVLSTSFIGFQASGIHDTSFQSNTKCCVHIRKELYANVVLPSGTTMFQRIVLLQRPQEVVWMQLNTFSAQRFRC